MWSSDTGDRVAESSWVMVPQKASMDDNMVGPCYSPPDEGKEGCKGFSKQLKEISDWQTGTQGNFWHLLERQCSNSGSQEDFWAASGTTSSHRLPDAPVRADVQLRLLLTNREGLDGDMVTNGCLGCSDQETAPDPERSEQCEHQSTGPMLLESRFPLVQVGRIPWETVLKRKELKRTIRPLGRTSSKHEHTPSP